MKKLFILALVGMFMLAGCSSNQPNQGENESPNEGVQENPSNHVGNNENIPNENEGQTDSDNENSNQNENQSADEFDKGRAEVVLTEYEKAFKKVVSYVDDQQKQKEYSTKQELIEHFEHFMSSELAQSWADTYFEEKEDGLYVKATEGPIFLQEDEAFSFSKTDGTAEVVQERKNQLMGHVEMKYMLSKQKDNIWIVEQVQRNEIKE